MGIKNEFEHDVSVIKEVTQKQILEAQGVVVGVVANVEAVEQEVVEEIDKIEQAVRAWFIEHIHNSPASQDTTVYNHITSGIGKLIAKIKEVV